MKKTIPQKSARAQAWLKTSRRDAPKGEAICERAFRKRSDPKRNGKIICINCETEEFVMGETVLDVLAKAEKKCPNAFFSRAARRSPAVYSLNGVQDFEA
ncbi:MAG: hypothetical protein NZM06_04975 [Chloroherpetonaceae bacterium]|nr:hypothetical protein [Chloroherpetonaceae bacterium]